MPRRTENASKRRLAPEFGERRRKSQSLNAEIALLVKALHELAAIRSTAEQAAGRILASAEGLMVDAATGVASRAETEKMAIAIMTACGFHDLVGQRATKIAETLDQIIGARLKRVDRSRKKAGAERQKRKAALMLTGPGLPTGSPDQARIDALFADA